MVCIRCAFLFVLIHTICSAQVAAPVEAPSNQAESADIGQEDTGLTEETVADQPGETLLHERGDILMARRMYREAIEIYEEGIRESAVMANKIGIAYHHLTDYDAALENYKLALQLNPDYPEAINNLGAVYFAQKKYGRAIREYERALKIAPHSASVYMNMGTCYFARKQYNRAFEAWQQAVDLDTGIFDRRGSGGGGTMIQERGIAERAQFNYYLAKTYAKAGLVKQALDSMRKALEEGFQDRNKFRNDPEFKDMQELEEFQALLALQPRVL